MTRLIDADALLINLDGMMEVSPTGYIHGETVADMISDAPTVDEVQVIWCKDCKHFDKDEFCHIWEVYRTNESYCDLAEREEE